MIVEAFISRYYGLNHYFSQEKEKKSIPALTSIPTFAPTSSPELSCFHSPNLSLQNSTPKRPRREVQTFFVSNKDNSLEVDKENMNEDIEEEESQDFVESSVRHEILQAKTERSGFRFQNLPITKLVRVFRMYNL